MQSIFKGPNIVTGPVHMPYITKNINNFEYHFFWTTRYLDGRNPVWKLMNIPKLNNKNFISWKEMVMMALEIKGLLAALREENVDLRTYLSAKFLLVETMDESHRGQVKGYKTEKGVMKRLEQVYADRSESNIIRLMATYMGYQKSATDNISEHMGVWKI